VLVPTVLPAGEYAGASGRRARAALAYDLAARIDDAAATPHAYPRAFHPAAVFGHFGAAVATGCLLGLDASGFERALGLAGQLAWVTVETTDGATYHEGGNHARGSRQNPLPPAKPRTKFDDCAGRRLGAARAAAVAGLVERLETLPDIGELMAALA
jgi:2-methylcitrate dehydratase PrpD